MAFADLADPGVEAVLERHCAHPNMRGIRFMVNYIEDDPLYCMTDRGDWLRDPQWRQGYALLEKHELSFDLQVYHHQMADAAALAGRHPGIPVLLNHAGLPVRTRSRLSRRLARRHADAGGSARTSRPRSPA